MRLRGAPLLLSPADFQVARRWRREGVRSGWSRHAREVFEKRRERGASRRINSLRYCAPAVEAAWAEVHELQGPARREPAEEPPVEERLTELAAALPESLAERDAWERRLLALRGRPRRSRPHCAGSTTSCSRRSPRRSMPTARERLDAEVDAILDGLRDRFRDTDLEALRGQLRRQRLRRLVGLPVLTLF